jgi:hypothetical protein
VFEPRAASHVAAIEQLAAHAPPHASAPAVAAVPPVTGAVAFDDRLAARARMAKINADMRARLAALNGGVERTEQTRAAAALGRFPHATPPTHAAPPRRFPRVPSPEEGPASRSWVAAATPSQHVALRARARAPAHGTSQRARRSARATSSDSDDDGSDDGAAEAEEAAERAAEDAAAQAAMADWVRKTSLRRDSVLAEEAAAAEAAVAQASAGADGGTGGALLTARAWAPQVEVEEDAAALAAPRAPAAALPRVRMRRRVARTAAAAAESAAANVVALDHTAAAPPPPRSSAVPAVNLRRGAARPRPRATASAQPRGKGAAAPRSAELLVDEAALLRRGGIAAELVQERFALAVAQNRAVQCRWIRCRAERALHCSNDTSRAALLAEWRETGQLRRSVYAQAAALRSRTSDARFAAELAEHAAAMERVVASVLPLAKRGGFAGQCSFMYRYILRESCSQFDSLPLTSLRNAAALQSRSVSVTLLIWRRTWGARARARWAWRAGLSCSVSVPLSVCSAAR